MTWRRIVSLSLSWFLLVPSLVSGAVSAQISTGDSAVAVPSDGVTTSPNSSDNPPLLVGDSLLNNDTATAQEEVIIKDVKEVELPKPTPTSNQGSDINVDEKPNETPILDEGD